MLKGNALLNFIGVLLAAAAAQVATAPPPRHFCAAINSQPQSAACVQFTPRRAVLDSRQETG
jgi:hypothetical protein